jgi:YDG domain-containing protein/Big-like domain-containing protein
MKHDMKSPRKETLKIFGRNPQKYEKGQSVKTLLWVTLLSVGLALHASAQMYSSQTYTNGFQNAGAIPDGSLNGWSDTRTVTGAGVHHVANVQVSLTISNGYAGDLYAYLVHSNGLAVLLNRVGLASTNPFGYADAGLDVTLSAAVANDVHFYQNFSPTYNGNGWLTGTWLPDARGIDPLSAPSAFDAPGTTNFDAFLNQGPNGDWTLYVADVSAGGGQSTLIRWGLQINTVTEPATNLVITSVNGGVAPTAGTSFSVVIQAQDVNGVAANVTADTAVILSLKSGDGSLSGTLTGTISNGTSLVTITRVTYSKAQSVVAITVTRTSGNNLIAGDSSTFTVNPGPFAQLQVLAPGETAAPGTATGKTGTPSAQTVATALNVTVNAVDANWNLISTNDTVHVTSSDGSAVLASDTGLSGGTGTFSVSFFTAGSQTVTASDVTHAGIAQNTGSATTVNAGEQTITFISPGDQTYGVAPITLTATASSGLVVAYAVTAGPATVIGNTITLIGAGSVTIQASQAGNANWNAAPLISRTITVYPRSLTPNITANDKVYDGNTSATIVTRSLTGVINGDAVSLTGGTATFTDQFVGPGKTVTAPGLSLSGTDAGKYVLASTTAATTASITTATVTIASDITANSKVYDTTTTATLSSNSVVLTGVLSGDTANVSLSTNSYTANFADSAVGQGKSVTVGGLTLTGSAAANYTLTQPAGLTANITAAGVTIASGITANSKVYNTTTTATLSSNNVVLTGVLSGDTANVSLSTNSYVAHFADAAVGLGKSVTVSGLSLMGSAAANYTLTQPADLTGDITAAGVTIASGITANSKVYDTTTTATLSSNNVVLTGVLSGDTSNVALSTNNYTASFATATVGTGKPVTVTGLSLTGTAAGNYSLTEPAGLTANITAGTVTQLAFTTQPGLASAGAAFGQQPAVTTQDQYGNDSTVGLGASLLVTVTLTSGTGSLQGTTTLDIGTSAGNGTVSFTNLRIDPAGTKQLTASASGLTPTVSATFSIANVPPVASTASFLRPRNVPLKILISDLLTNASDLNGDTLQLVGVSAASTNGAALYTNATYVLYSLPPGGNVSDSFNYTVSDGTTSTMGTVLISIAPDPTGTNSNIVAYGLVNGLPTLTFAGVPGYTYLVQRTQDLTTHVWTNLLTTNAPAGGLFQFVDPNPPNGNLFYRAQNQ